MQISLNAELHKFRKNLIARLDSLERGEFIEPDEWWSEFEEMSADGRRFVR